MDGPSEDFRAYLVQQAERVESEDQLEDLLGEIEKSAERDVSGEGDVSEYNAEQATDLLAAVQSWSTVISDTMARFSAPSSPWRQGLAGWGKSLLRRLQRIVRILLTPLRLAAKTLQASSYSIGLNFPWGVSVSLTWS